MATRKKSVQKGVARTEGSTPPRAEADSVHILEVTLLDVQPRVWRRIAVPSAFTLGQLHDVLQVAMGWTNSHFHQFEVGGTKYSDPAFGLDDVDLDGVSDEGSLTVAQALPREGSHARYEYDFGDDWEHLLRVEKAGPSELGVMAPLCLEGARACPPEDCGGPFGYPELLEALRDPKSARHEELLEWLGGGFDPEAFDLEAVNRELRQLWQAMARAAPLPPRAPDRAPAGRAAPRKA
jgi:hypothetical protein